MPLKICNVQIRQMDMMQQHTTEDTEYFMQLRKQEKVFDMLNTIT